MPVVWLSCMFFFLHKCNIASLNGEAQALIINSDITILDSFFNNKKND